MGKKVYYETGTLFIEFFKGNVFFWGCLLRRSISKTHFSLVFSHTLVYLLFGMGSKGSFYKLPIKCNRSAVDSAPPLGGKITLQLKQPT